MRVLILGGGGFIGAPLASRLQALGVEPVPASRRGALRDGISLDRGDIGSVLRHVREARIDAVVDLLALTDADTLPLLAALDGEVGRYVMASSADVYSHYEGLHRLASPSVRPGALGEDAPLRTTRHPYRASPPRDPAAPDAWMDAYDKIPLEAALRARPLLGGVILRLPMVYGPGDRQRRFRWIARPLLAGRPRLEAPAAWLDWRTTYGFVDDVASALAAAATHPRAAGRTFNVGEASPPTHRGWVARFAAAAHWTGEVAETPPPRDGPVAALDLRYPLVLDSSAIREALGWTEPTPVEEAVARTLADEQTRG